MFRSILKKTECKVLFMNLQIAMDDYKANTYSELTDIRGYAFMRRAWSRVIQRVITTDGDYSNPNILSVQADLHSRRFVFKQVRVQEDLFQQIVIDFSKPIVDSSVNKINKLEADNGAIFHSAALNDEKHKITLDVSLFTRLIGE